MSRNPPSPGNEKRGRLAVAPASKSMLLCCLLGLDAQLCLSSGDDLTHPVNHVRVHGDGRDAPLARLGAGKRETQRDRQPAVPREVEVRYAESVDASPKRD